MNTSPTTEERVWAVLSHLSALGLGMGILLPIIGWSEQRRKSKYVSFHCLQALGYQSLGFTVWMLSMLLIAIVLFFVMVLIVGIAVDSERSSATLSNALGFVLVLMVMGLFGTYFLLPIVAAVACGMGKDFRYPILGKRLAGYLGYEQTSGDGSEWLIEEHEERWVAAMGHFAVIIYLWGLLAPIATWIAQGKHSTFLKFQSVQTVVYQGFATLLYFGAGFVYMFGFVIFLALAGFEGSPYGSISSTNMIGLISLFISMMVAMLIMLIMPLFHILGQWAGYRVLKGDDYHYPLIGKFVERWVANKNVDDSLSPEGKTS